MVRRGFRGWEVELLDGTLINEEDMDWKNVPKKDIKSLTLHYDGRSWTVYGKEGYFQKKRASVAPWVANSFQVESRSIGYYEGNIKIAYTVDEFTGKMKMETIQ